MQDVVHGIAVDYSRDNLFDELVSLEWDKKVLMYGRVVNKKARHNLCFSNFSQEADYENKKGTTFVIPLIKYKNYISILEYIYPFSKNIQLMLNRLLNNLILGNLSLL